jgi:serine/threonine-protein kinase
MSIDQELAETLPVKPGMVIGGKYRVERLLAAGGMGAVLVAHHEILDRPVAIKLVRPELSAHAEIVQRFLREARAAAKIASDYVARVTDVDLLEQKTPYMVMELLVGRDLLDTMDGQPRMPLATAVDITLQALMGLSAAHAKGIIHRDLKPSNLFLEQREDGTVRVKLLDFGISKVIEGEAQKGAKSGATTESGQMLGTPRYMSPEQISDSKTVDPRTDIWAMGVILYEMLTNVYPFEGDTAGSILSNILTRPVQPLRELRPDVPAEVEQILESCLAKKREGRPASAAELVRMLAPFASRRMQALVLAHDDPAALEPTSGAPRPAEAKTPPLDAARSEPAQVATVQIQRGSQSAPHASPDTDATGLATTPNSVRNRPSEPVVPSAPPSRDPTPQRESFPISAGNRAPSSEDALSGRGARVSNLTDVGMVREARPAASAGWKIGLVGAGVVAVAVIAYLAGRTPASPSLSALAGTSAARPSPEPQPAAQSPVTVTPMATSSASADTASSAAPAASAASTLAPATSSAPLRGARPKPSGQPAATGQPGNPGAGGIIRTRD